MVGGGWKDAPQNETPSCLYKIIAIGDTGVGKSSIIQRFAFDRFNPLYTATIGVDFAIKVIQSPKGEIIKLQIWDTAGQERFRTITNSYYRGAHGVIITFSLTNSESYHTVERWLEECRRYCMDDIAIVIVATNADMGDQREVSEEQIKVLSENTGHPVMEVSSKDGTGISEAFFALTQTMMQQHEARRENAVAMSSTRDAGYANKALVKTKKGTGKSAPVADSNEHSNCSKSCSLQ